MPDRTPHEELYFACEEVLMAAHRGNGQIPASSDEVIIPFKTLQIVVAALKKADEAKNADKSSAL